MTASTPALRTWPDPAALARGVADWLLEEALAAGERFALCLSGGTTPKALYALLATAPYRDRFPWARTHLFWGDERFVGPDDPLSNFRMVREALIDHVPIPPANVHPVQTVGTDPAGSAAAYQATLQAFHGAGRPEAGHPLFDVVLLGLGEDGHTASLFPGTAVLEERTRWVAPVVGAKAEARITLTYPALESSRQVAFLTEGEGKRAKLAAWLGGDDSLPAARVHPRGALAIFCDAAADPRARR